MAKGWMAYRTCENQNALCPLLHTSVPFVHAAPYGMSQPVCGCLPPDLHVRHRSQVHTRVLILRLAAREHRSGANAGAWVSRHSIDHRRYQNIAAEFALASEGALACD